MTSFDIDLGDRWIRQARSPGTSRAVSASYG
jgi:hypothetical protein